MKRFRLMAIAAAMAITAIPTAGLAGDDYEEVVFRVTLEGPVNPSHTFAVERQCAEQICVTEDIVIVCSPPNAYYDYPVCSATTYEFTSTIRAGLTVEYALLRWTTPDLSQRPEEYLHGTWVVREGSQTISLGYVYPGAAPSEPSSGPVLPDTALPQPSDR